MDISEIFIKDCSRNLIQNGGMEIGNPPTGWMVTGSPTTYERSNAWAKSGIYSAHVADSIPSYGGFYQNIILRVGRTYKISGWVNVISGTMKVQVYDDVLGAIVYQDFVPGISYLNLSFICPSGITVDSLYFTNLGNSVAAEFYVDDVFVQEV